MTVFNLGPSGNLNLLSPDRPDCLPEQIAANEAFHVLDVEMTPPTGRERLCAIWTRKPRLLSVTHLQSLADGGELPVSRAYQATRDMQRVRQTLEQCPSDDWDAATLELEHEH